MTTRFTLKAAASALALALSIGAASAQDRVSFDIESQPLSRALLEFNEQSGLTVAAPSDLVNGRTAPAVEGSLEPSEALTLLLADSGLKTTQLPSGAITVTRASADETVTEARPFGNVSQGEDAAPVHLAQLDPRDDAGEREVEDNQEDERAEDAQLLQDTIVVTANRREQSLQDAPGSISVLDVEELAQRGATELREVLQGVPSVAFVDNGAGQGAIVIRGTTTSPQGEGSGPTVVTYLDEAQVGGSYGGTFALVNIKPVDIERLELLRGPQGTLYGAGSIGGTLRYLTNRPDTSGFAASVTAGAKAIDTADDLGYELQGMVNLPIIEDKLAIRAVGYIDEDADYITNILTGDQVGGQTVEGGRISFQFEPTSRLTLFGQGVYQKEDSNGAVFVQPPFDSITQNRLGGEGSAGEVLLFNNEVNYTFDSVLLEVITTISEEDFSLTSLIFGSQFLDQTIDRDRFSQEVRLSSRGNGPAFWLIGAYYDQREETIDQIVSFVDEIPGLEPIDFPGAAQNIEQIAVFADLTFALTEKWSVSGGARWSQFDQESTDPFTGAVDGDTLEDIITPRLVIQYEPNDQATLYAQASQGYRQGGRNYLNVPPCPTGNLTFDSDNLWSYEIGSKLSSRDGKATLNAAAFYIDWQEIPVAAADECGSFRLLNASSARSVGLEVEATWSPTDRLDFAAGFSLTDAELREDIEFVGQAGEQLPFAPDFNFGGNATYTHPLGEGRSLFGNVNVFHISEYKNFLSGAFSSTIGFDPTLSEDDNTVGGYTDIGLTFGYSTDQFSATLFASNLLNEDGIIFLNSNTLESLAVLQRPRTIGVSISHSF